MPWTHRTFWIGPLIIAGILGLFALVVFGTHLRRVYNRQFPESRRERLFLASVGFFVTAFVIRGITIAIHNDIGPFHNITMHGRHIHHLVWGIILLLVVGYSWLNQIGTGGTSCFHVADRLTSMLYGVAAALTLDEFALWLNLSDVYWSRQGRESYEALALFGGLLGMSVYGGPFFKGVFLHLFKREAPSR